MAPSPRRVATLITVGLVLFGGGCVRSPKVEAAPPPPADPPSTATPTDAEEEHTPASNQIKSYADHHESTGPYVLVSWDAWLYRAPDPEADRVRYTYPTSQWKSDRRAWGLPPEPGPATIPELQQRGFTFRLVHDAGDWLELETLGDEHVHHCHPGIVNLGNARIRLFVRAEDLLQVTARSIERSYDDGTSVRIAAGKGVRPLDGGHYEILADPYPNLLAGETGGRRLRVELAPDDVSTSWMDLPYPELEGRPLDAWTDADCNPVKMIEIEDASDYRASSGCALRVWQAREGGERQPWYTVDSGRVYAGRIVHAGVRELENADTAVVDLRCVELQVAIEHKKLARPLGQLKEIAAGEKIRSLPAVEMLRDTLATHDARGPAWWPDGTPAGRIDSTVPLEDGQPHPGLGTCYLVPLRPDARPENTLALCVGSTALSR